MLIFISYLNVFYLNLKICRVFVYNENNWINNKLQIINNEFCWKTYRNKCQ